MSIFFNPKAHLSIGATLVSLTLSIGLSGCGGSDSSSSSNTIDAEAPPSLGNPSLVIPDTYAFENTDGVSTVSYTGQTKRHVLINDLTQTLLDEDIASNAAGESANVLRSLNFYYQFDGDTSDDTESLFMLDSQSLIADDDTSPDQAFTYGQISSGKNLQGKIAGNDPALLDDRFDGWSEGLSANPTPDSLINYWFSEFANNVTDGTQTAVPVVDGASFRLEAYDAPYYVDSNGLDYRQLVQKFLSVAVAFSQGTADYLSIDFGSDENLALEEGKPYTVGQHDFDEAFGYFGAARDYDQYTDSEIKDPSYRDSNNDGSIDIRSEYNFGHSTNCAKRDLGSADDAKTDFTQEVFDAFLSGRTILQAAALEGELTSERETELNQAIEAAALTWEKCIAATVVHYINDMRAHLDTSSDSNDESVFSASFPAFLSLDDYLVYAKHYSEMKGFALGLQFSPFSPFRDTATSVDMDDLRLLLSKMADSPFMPDVDATSADLDGRMAYSDALLEARDILEEAYDFDPINAAGW